MIRTLIVLFSLLNLTFTTTTAREQLASCRDARSPRDCTFTKSSRCHWVVHQQNYQHDNAHGGSCKPDTSVPKCGDQTSPERCENAAEKQKGYNICVWDGEYCYFFVGDFDEDDGRYDSPDEDTNDGGGGGEMNEKYDGYELDTSSDGENLERNFYDEFDTNDDGESRGSYDGDEDELDYFEYNENNDGDGEGDGYDESFDTVKPYEFSDEDDYNEYFDSFDEDDEEEEEIVLCEHAETDLNCERYSKKQASPFQCHWIGSNSKCETFYKGRRL